MSRVAGEANVYSEANDHATAVAATTAAIATTAPRNRRDRRHHRRSPRPPPPPPPRFSRGLLHDSQVATVDFLPLNCSMAAVALLRGHLDKAEAT